MGGSKPRLSIGMPVFNGERHIRYAIDSILAQTYQDFELIISDNASTDKTQSICLQYAANDGRIRYYRNKKNLGATANYNRVFMLSSGEYFKWATHDDLLAPEYLEKCVRVLDSDASIVLCHSKVGRVDENGVSVKNYDDKTLSNLCSWKPHERFSDMISPRAPPWAIMGVVRAELLAKTPLHGCHIGSDTTLLAELSLMGRIYEIPEYLFFRREHPQAYSNVYGSIIGIHDYRRQLSWWGGNKKNFLLVLPRWKYCLEFFRSVNRVPLKFSERCLCYIEIARLILQKERKRLIWELFNEFQLWRIRLHYGQAKKGVSKSN